MKKTDIATIIFIASVSILVSYFVANSVFGNVSQGTSKVKTIEPIDAEIVAPRTDIFNKDAINPAVQIEITGRDSPDGTTQSTGSQ